MSKGKNRQFTRKQARAALRSNPLATPKGTLGKLARSHYGGGVGRRDLNDTRTDRNDPKED